MPKYHLRKDNIPAVCKATESACPRGGSDEHYDDLETAMKAGLVKLDKEFHTVPTLSKDDTLYHLSDTGEPEECVYRVGMCTVKPYNKYGNYHSQNIEDLKIAADNMGRIENKIQTPRPAPTPKVTLPVKTNIINTGERKLERIEEGDIIYGTKKVTNRVGYCGPSTEQVLYNSIQDALDDGFSIEEIRVKTIGSCHHSSHPVDPNIDDNYKSLIANNYGRKKSHQPNNSTSTPLQ